MERNVMINGIPAVLKYSEENIENLFKPLLLRLKEMYEIKKNRIVVFVAAPPGAGKTSLTDFLEYLSTTLPEMPKVNGIGMDGFHRYQDYLLSHTTIRDGKEICMVDIKGAPETFDLDRLAAFINRLRTEDSLGWPVYNRMTHNPKEDAILVDGDIVILEGNYLLLKDKGWNELKAYADYTISIDADEEILRERLIDRKIKCGNSVDKAISFVDNSDMVNVRVCKRNSQTADLNLRMLADDTYEVIQQPAIG